MRRPVTITRRYQLWILLSPGSMTAEYPSHCGRCRGSFIEVSVTRLKPAKNHSANVLSELLVIIFQIFPLPVAVWKRRKSFTVTRSGASTCFLRTRSRTAASFGIGSPSRRASSFISSRCQLKYHVSIDPSPRGRRQRPSHRT
jgi:hypothetical protein